MVCDAHNTALEHAWNHFAYHANQRLVTFRFYLVLVTIFIGAFLTTMSDGLVLISTILASLGSIFSYVFLQLDIRNTDLLEPSKQTIIREENYLEEKLAQANDAESEWRIINIVAATDAAKCKRTWRPRSYGGAMKFMYLLMIGLFSAGVIVPHIPGSASQFEKRSGTENATSIECEFSLPNGNGGNGKLDLKCQQSVDQTNSN